MKRFLLFMVVAIAVAGLLVGQALPQKQGPAFPTPRSFELVEATIPEIQEALTTHFLNSKQLTKLYLDRIAAYNPLLDAVGYVNPNAVETAHWLDVARAQGKAHGLLWGIPVLLKDNINTDDMPTTAGSVALAGSIPHYDAFITRKLRDAGAIIIGKGTLTEFANYIAYSMPSGYSSMFGYGLNPYDPRTDPRTGLDSAGFPLNDGRPVLTPGGSSSGPGIAASANLATVTVGTETSGSILSPSSANDVVGIKPTVGLVSRTGIIPITADQDTAGPITRTVTDAAILLGVLAGYDPADPATTPCLTAGHCFSDYTQFLNPSALNGARIGYDTYYWSSNPERRQVMLDAIDVMTQMGATLIPVSLATARSNLSSYTSSVLKYGMKRDLNLYLASLGPNAPVKTLADVIAYNNAHAAVALKYGQGLLLDSQAVDLSPNSPDTIKYQQDRHNDYTYATQGIDGVMSSNNLDALLAPGNSFASMPAKAGYPSVCIPGGLVPNTAANLPAGFNPRLGPYGVTLAGRAWSEPRLIALAYSLEQAFKRRTPPFSTPPLDKDVKGNPH